MAFSRFGRFISMAITPARGRDSTTSGSDPAGSPSALTGYPFSQHLSRMDRYHSRHQTVDAERDRRFDSPLTPENIQLYVTSCYGLRHVPWCEVTWISLVPDGGTMTFALTAP